MNGATMKLRRLAMGTPTKAMADRLGCEPRTLQRWESGEWSIPDADAERFQTLWGAWLDKITDVLDQLDQTGETFGEPQGVDLSLYQSEDSARRALGVGMTWGEHTRFVATLMTLLEIEGHEVRGHWTTDES